MRHLREGGLVAFQELDSTACRSWPAVPIFEEAARWLAEGLRSSGARPELGLEMHSLFADCGLPAPKMRTDTLVSGEGDSPVYMVQNARSRSNSKTASLYPECNQTCAVHASCEYMHRPIPIFMAMGRPQAHVNSKCPVSRMKSASF